MVREKGFSLIELLIVVAIILVIAAIAIPNLLRSRIAANEASAVSAVRAITTAEHAYSATYPNLGYTCTLTDLGQPASGQPFSESAAGILDPVVASGTKSGYSFSLTNCPARVPNQPTTSYQSAATPVTVGQSGQRSFCSDGSGIIRYSDDGQSTTCFANMRVLQ